ncbi:hypothetical protein V6N13_037332 [Hibiscus sabdariffa]|uniref:Uncharacterized protein n=1 Tax=Hibiscus sabdariffa TaxID=183260 RepID=A0ABR2E9P5_9ROSI
MGLQESHAREQPTMHVELRLGRHRGGGSPAYKESLDPTEGLQAAASKPQAHTTTATIAKRKEDALVKPHKRHDNIDTNTYRSVHREIECTTVVTNNPSASG